MSDTTGTHAISNLRAENKALLEEIGRRGKIILALAMGAYTNDTFGDMKEDAARACELIDVHLPADDFDDGDEEETAKRIINDRLDGASLWTIGQRRSMIDTNDPLPLGLVDTVEKCAEEQIDKAEKMLTEGRSAYKDAMRYRLYRRTRSAGGCCARCGGVIDGESAIAADDCREHPHDHYGNPQCPPSPPQGVPTVATS